MKKMFNNNNISLDDSVVLMSFIGLENIEIHSEDTIDSNDNDIKSPSSLENIQYSNSEDENDFIPKVKKGAHTRPMELSHFKRKIKKRFQCKFCLKSFTASSNMYRHKEQCRTEIGKANNLKCLTCSKVFSRLDSLKRHKRICTIKTKRHIACCDENCTATFYKKTDLIEHLKIQHKFGIKKEQELKFQNTTEFTKWKDKIEEETFSYFSKRNRNAANVSFYYCQRDGSSQAHRKSGEEPRKTNRRNSKGQIREDKICTAYIRVQTEPNESLTVTYQPTHLHSLNPMDFRHHPLSNSTETYIDKQLALGNPPKKIASDLAHLVFKCSERQNPITKNQIIDVLPRIQAKKWRRQARMKKNHDVPATDGERRQTSTFEKRRRIRSNINSLAKIVENDHLPDLLLSKIQATTTNLLNACKAAVAVQHS